MNPELARQHARVQAARARIHAGVPRPPDPEPSRVAWRETASPHVQHVRDYRRVLRSRGSAGPRPSDVLEVAAEVWRVSLVDLMGASREVRHVRPRQAAMHVCRRWSSRSLAEIARACGRDHQTVLHGCRVVAEEVERWPDEALARRIRAVLRRLGLDGRAPLA